ncbi:UNVERIFIED_CONTAM: hypothetical protein PYX00_004691 [Menopon gallinae]|uniref:Transcription initiation factor IIF subunit alpha n=1 Tax=Menopon gallinae TaxID=328185 RepID=A0AAW2I6C3_9NEOP
MATYTAPTCSTGAKPAPQGSCQEFSIRVPKSSKKKYHVMRFNSSLGVDFTKWKSQNIQVKMERENNFKEFKGTEEEMPKYGAGSEFGREAREEARRKKYGYVARKYKPEDQPWILKQGGKTGKKFKGIREGGVSDNTAYYVFTQAGNGIIEAYPLQEWYKFQPIQRYKALSAEEAEQEYGRRNKIINYFSLMLKKRLRNDEDGELEDPDEVKNKKGGSKKKEKDLKISEMDDWDDMDDENSESDEEKASDDEEGGKKGKKKGNKKGAPKKKKKDSDDEAVEESDDGDEEGRELDYISDSSESASDHEMKVNKELKGVAEEDALRKLLNSESEDEEEENEEKKDQNASNSEDEESKAKKEKADKESGEKTKEESVKKKKLSKNNKKKSNKKSGKKDGDDSSSELSPNSTDSDSDTDTKSKPPPSKTKDVVPNSAESSRSATPTPLPVAGEKRKLTPSELAVAAAKKAKLDISSSPGSSNTSYLINNSDTGVTEDAVRRYLMRKPMTTTELLHKFKSKKTGLSSEQLVNVMTQILKNINPVKQIIKNKMYLSIKPT